MMRFCCSFTVVLAAGILLGSATAATVEADARGQATEGVRPYWVFFEEPAPGELLRSAPALSPRAVERLARVGRVAGSDIRDHPLPSSSLAPLRERGIEIRRLSRWLRAASALLSETDARRLAEDPRVRALRPVERYVRPLDPIERPQEMTVLPRGGAREGDPRETDPTTLTGADYAGAWEQLEMLGVPELHARGLGGLGVLIAVFDTGFLKEHEALSSLDLIAERDYVRGDDDVQYDPSDPLDTPQANNHGTYTWSTIAGFAPGRHLGAAYRASFVLARTEDVQSEVHLEEDNYIAALEWADSLGADIVSSSLGYRYGFDDGSEYTIDQLNGDSLAITVATEIAAERGILVVTAMGNDGPADSTLNAPADGKRVVSVGAVDFWGGVTSFSSRGPTGDGRTKPDVLALGFLTQCALPFDLAAYGRVNGTSLSTPLITGLAALLLEASREANRSWTPDSLIAILHAAGDHAGTPDNTYGWGVPDGLRALEIEQDRLRVVRYEWSEEGGGDGVVEWGETGEIQVWLRNEGMASSPAVTLELTDLDERIVLEEAGAAVLPSIAPGDSLASGVLGRLVIPPGEEIGQLSFFVRISDGAIAYERKVYLPIPEPSAPLALGSVYPNPVRTGPVEILFSQASGAQSRLEIYSVDGRLVRAILQAGSGTGSAPFVWDLRDGEGRSVPAGIYLARQPGGATHRICVVR